MYFLMLMYFTCWTLLSSVTQGGIDISSADCTRHSNKIFYHLQYKMPIYYVDILTSLCHGLSFRCIARAFLCCNVIVLIKPDNILNTRLTPPFRLIDFMVHKLQ